METRLNKADRESLLEEYRSAHQFVIAMHGHTWQIGGILIVASLGVFALLAERSTGSIKGLVLSFFAGGFSSILLIAWYSIMERISFFIEVSYHRLREIEIELGLRRNLYIHCLDNPDDFSWGYLSEAEKKNLARIQADIQTAKRKLGFQTLLHRKAITQVQMKEHSTGTRIIMKRLIQVIILMWVFWVWIVAADIWVF
jgi:hypothetical protein